MSIPSFDITLFCSVILFAVAAEYLHHSYLFFVWYTHNAPLSLGISSEMRQVLVNTEESPSDRAKWKQCR